MPIKRPYKQGKVPKQQHQEPHHCTFRYAYTAGDWEYHRCAVCGRYQRYRVR